MTTSNTTDPVNYFEIGTADPAAARAFYGGLFGWEFGPANPGGYATVEGNAGGLWDTSGIGGESWAVFYVEVVDIHATMKDALAAGAVTVRPLVDNGAILFTHLADPSGSRFGVWQRRTA